MRASSLFLSIAGSNVSFLHLSFFLLVCLAPAFSQSALFTPAQLPDLDLSSLGRIALTGDFDAISLYLYEQQQDAGSAVLNGSQAQSLIAPLPNGALVPITSADADIRALCSLRSDNGEIVVVGGNFTSLGRVETSALAIFDPASAQVRAAPGLSGQVSALLCDSESNTVYVGGDFRAPGSSNAIKWSPGSGFSRLPFGGFNGPVTSIIRAQDGRIIFGGSFDGLGNTTSPSLRDQQFINLETAQITAGASSNIPGFDDPRNVICNADGIDGPGNTWLLPDNAPGFWRSQMRFGFQPTKLRIYNTHQDGRGTKTFRFTALPDTGILNMTYIDPQSGDTIACEARCPLSDDPAEPFRDFRFVNVVGMNGFRLDISEWYGQGGGFAGVELFQDDIYSYAVNDFNEPACAGIPFRSQSSSSGPWNLTPRGGTYDYLSARPGPSDPTPFVSFQPNVRQSGNYSVTVFTPGCVQDGTCGSRAVANITATLTRGAEPISVLIFQTNNFDKYDQIYLGQVDAGSSDFRPTVTLQPQPGQQDGLDIAASRVRFQLISTTGGLNGLFEFDPAAQRFNTDFSKSPVNRAGTDLERGAAVKSLQWSNDVLFVGGDFSNSSLANIMSLNRGRATSLPSRGLNSAVNSLLLMGDLLFVGGNFTGTLEGENRQLQYVGAFSASNNSWVPLGSGVNGPVSTLVRFPVNISEEVTEMAVAVSGSFTQINAYGDLPSVSAAGFAVWVPSQNSWLNHLSINQMAYVGQLSTSVGLVNETLLAGTLASGGISSHGAASLTDEDELVLRSLPVNIQLDQSVLPARKRATGSPQTAGVLTGVYDNDSTRNITILAGHFTARATDGSVVDNVLFLDGSKNDRVTGPPPGIDSESVFVSVAIQGDLLYAGGTVTGSIGESEVNGLVVYNLATGRYHTPQPGSLMGERVVVNAIAPRPESSDVYVGGDFSSAASLPCPGVCNFQRESSQWRRPGAGLQGTVYVLKWISSESLLAAGNLTVGGNQTMLASFNPETQEWSDITAGSSTKVAGPITTLGLARQDGSRFWIAGKTPAGIAFLMYYDGSDFRPVDSIFGERTTIEGLEVLALSENHGRTDFLENNQMLLVTGQLQLPRFGLVSAALFNGTALTPFILSSKADGTAGRIVGMFSENENTYSGGRRPRSRGIVVLISFCLALACIFLIVLVGLIVGRIRRYRQGYVPARNGTDRRPDLTRVPPEYLLESLRQRAPGAPAI